MLSNKSVKLTNGNDKVEVPATLAKQFVENFHVILPEVIDGGLSKLSYMNSEKVKARIKDMSLNYTLEKKPIMGELMLYAYELLNGPVYPDEKTRQQAYTFACIMELGLSQFLFMDDIEDDSKIRCSKTCWHLLPNVGPLAMNDSCILRSFIHELLQQNFPESTLLRLINYVNEVYFVTAIGQHMDTELANKRCYDNYTKENFLSMTLNKQLFIITAPIVFALFLANKATNESIQQVQEICRDIAILLQIQATLELSESLFVELLSELCPRTRYNDVMDLKCDGLKSCTDIPKAKCSWLAVKALEMCNEDQRNVFEKHYGSWDPMHIKRILELYEELELSEVFVEEQRARHESFLRKVNELPPNVTPGAKFYQQIFKLMISFRI